MPYKNKTFLNSMSTKILICEKPKNHIFKKNFTFCEFLAIFLPKCYDKIISEE
jgi:hypothetical protein